jgi:hypothetical protein
VEVLLALHKHAGTKPPRGLLESAEDERAADIAEATGEVDDAVDKAFEKVMPAEESEDAEQEAKAIAEAEEEDAELAAEVDDEPDLFAGIDEQTQEEIRAKVNQILEKEQEARGAIDMNDPSSTTEVLDSLEAEEADGNEEVKLQFRGHEAAKMVELLGHTTATNLETELEEEDMAAQAEQADAIAQNITRVQEFREQQIKDDAVAAEFLNTGPLAGTYEAAKAADRRLRDREINARIALADPTVLGSALVQEHLRRGGDLGVEEDEGLAGEDGQLPGMDQDEAEVEAMDDEHGEILDRLSAEEIDFLGPAEAAESRFENAMLSGDIARAAATVEEMQADVAEQDYDEEEDVKHADEIAKQATPADLKAGRRQYLLTLESMQALLDPKSVPEDNPIAKYIKYGGQPGALLPLLCCFLELLTYRYVRL